MRRIDSAEISLRCPTVIVLLLQTITTVLVQFCSGAGLGWDVDEPTNYFSVCSLMGVKIRTK